MRCNVAFERTPENGKINFGFLLRPDLLQEIPSNKSRGYPCVLNKIDLLVKRDVDGIE